MCKILPQIKELALNEGITIGALERIIGASKGVLSRAISNGTDIQSKWLVAIVENYPQYSPRWLLTGQGNMMSDADTLHNEEDIDTSILNESHNNSVAEYLDIKLKEKDSEIGNLRQKIGKLEARLEMMQAESNPSVAPRYAPYSIEKVADP